MVFIFNGKIYYPYGASSREHKELMAPNLLMWEIIKLGKKWTARVWICGEPWGQSQSQMIPGMAFTALSKAMAEI